ncbi:hypothetical protein L596_005657 [Steinernema carpocapsae]|uniref:Ubiquitin carboxyl-terminal hydrolase n=1 Tax=Steinernema carpocapsae TaxID=34508 RepID=A0A4U8V165_STECR|nr:hypothetical protein L596_005657 [Steinernema carpocapsae]
MSSDQNAAGPSAPFPDDPTVSPAKPPPYEETREKGVRDSPAVECIANEKDRNFKVRYIEQNWPQGTSRRVPIIMQDENGPCPLLAVVNCLTLQGCIRLPPSDINHGEISLATLTNVVGNHLLEQASKRENVAARETMSILNTCMEQMDKLKHGLDVEIKFDCITGVGETQMHGFFDLAGLNLYHGWVIDPEDEELVLGFQSDPLET